MKARLYQKWRVEFLLEVASRSTLGWCLATANWDRCVYCNHLCEDVEHGLWRVSDPTPKARYKKCLPWGLSCHRC
jgi:hypothetical protein